MTTSFLKKPAVKWLGYVVLVFSFYYLWKTYQDLQSQENIGQFLKENSLLVLALSISYFIACVFNAIGWSSFFPRSERKTLTSIYLRTQIGKYLPGNIGHFAGRQILLQNVGISPKAALKTHVLDLGASLTAAGFLSALLFLIQNDLAMYAGLLGVAGAFFLKKWAKKTFSSALPFYAMFLFLSSLIFFYLCLSIGQFEKSFPIEFLLAYQIAWIAGFVVVGAPGGIGVRETVLVYLLKPEFGGVILTAALAHRVIAIAGEGIGYIVVKLFVPVKEIDEKARS